MIAAPINPSDLLFVEGRYRRGPQLPSRIGFEGVGLVQDHGGGLLGRRLVGKRVVVLRPQGGTWGDHCVVPALYTIPVSSRISDDQAAAYFVNPASALMLTRYVLPVPVGNWLMQSAAASSLGRMIIRLGKHFRFRTLNLVRKPEQVAELKALGADEVLVVNDQTCPTEFRKQVSKICLSALPQYAIDPVGGAIGSLMVNALGETGRICAIAALSEDPVSVTNRTILMNRLKLFSFWLDQALLKLSRLEQLWFFQELHRLHLAGLFQVEQFQRFPLDQWEAAIQAAGSSTGGSKILLTMK